MKGTYCLLIRVDSDVKIKIGKQGEIFFPKGFYVYVGSALNSLEGRVARHLKKTKKIFWHIDYLLAHQNTRIMEVIWAENNKKYECKVSSILSENNAKIPNFGCSDCNCPSHLLYYKNKNTAYNACKNAYLKLGLRPGNLKELDLH